MNVNEINKNIDKLSKLLEDASPKKLNHLLAQQAKELDRYQNLLNRELAFGELVNTDNVNTYCQTLAVLHAQINFINHKLA